MNEPEHRLPPQRMVSTPSSSSSSSKSNAIHNIIKTPHSKHRLNFTSTRTPNPHQPQNPSSGAREATQGDNHPIEVVARIRDHPDRKEKPVPILHANEDSQALRVRSDIGYRDFTLDGVSFSEEEDIDAFYKKFVEARIHGVRMGSRCTIMMYGPTGSGKSHTMFGCAGQTGIVYRSLRDMLGEEGEEVNAENNCTFVQVTVLEIYNEELYDLLSNNSGNGCGGGFGMGWPKGANSGSKVRLEVMGKKAKNATCISGTEANKISKEIQTVEKRRVVKSTNCNDRSSRSHCMIILDVPTVGGRLMLVDMAGSENIEQAGQSGFEAKMQTAKINQGNIALRRVVESIANGDSHVPFRDSKLTMLLQDSFEDDKAKILMILCASPDPKEIHKTICTLEYGAKAKCIVRGPHVPNKDRFGGEDSSAVILRSRIAAMEQVINKLQMENKLREKERNEIQKQLVKKEEEIVVLKAREKANGSRTGEQEVSFRVQQLQRKVESFQKIAEDLIELNRRRMEERAWQQQQEVEMMKHRVEQMESQLCQSGDKNEDETNFSRKLLEACSGDEQSMVKSMDLDMGDQESQVPEVKHVDFPVLNSCNPRYGDKTCLSTVFEEDELDEEEEEGEIIEIKRIVDSPKSGKKSSSSSSSRQVRIQNIFTLCGNNRELYQHNRTPTPHSSPIKKSLQLMKNVPMTAESKENCNPAKEATDAQIEVHVKMETGTDYRGKPISTIKLPKDATLADLRKLIEIHLGAHNQAFNFLMLEESAGTLIPKEKESTKSATDLPVYNNQQPHSYLVCLLPASSFQQFTIPASSPMPLTPLENKLPLISSPHVLKKEVEIISPIVIPPHLSSTPFITLRRH